MSGGLHSLATIIKRLEAATSRLEDLAAAPDEHTITNQPRIETPTPEYAEKPAAALPPPPAAAQDPKSVIAFDEQIINGKLKPFLELTRSFGPANLIEQVSLFEQEYADLRALILLASSCQKPDQKAFGEILNPLQASIESIARIKEANRQDRDWFLHLSVVAEGAPSAGWVTIDMKPGPYVNDIKDSSVYYGNSVIKEYKDKDPKHAEWVRAYIAILDETRKYIMEYHATGLVWNPRGVPVAQYNATSSKTSTTSGGPPPPPPPPPAPTPATAPAASGGAAAVFAELNRGEEVTKGLRKVDKSEMTHKNPALRAGAVVSASTGPKKPTKPTKPQSLTVKKPKPPKFELEGNKWAIEYQENAQSLVVENGEINQMVNIFGCKNTTVVVKGKVNAVTLVSCVKTSVLVESVISSVAVTSSPSFTVQITGSAPTIQLDSTDSGQIYLSKDCLNVEITTAKCSSININLPVEGEEDGVFGEQAVPDMLKTVVQGGKLVTTVVEHVG